MAVQLALPCCGFHAPRSNPPKSAKPHCTATGKRENPVRGDLFIEHANPIWLIFRPAIPARLGRNGRAKNKSQSPTERFYKQVTPNGVSRTSPKRDKGELTDPPRSVCRNHNQFGSNAAVMTRP